MGGETKFRDTKNGRIINHTIHDHNTALSIIGSYIRGLKFRYENGSLNDEDFTKAYEGINVGLKKAIEAVDYSYVKLKEDFEQLKTE